MNAGDCIGCGRCLAVCPYRLWESGVAGVPELQAGWRARCLGCGHCAAVCPAGAVELKSGPGEEAVQQEAAPEAVLGWLRARRSVRQYRAQPVPREMVTQLLEAARCAPTGHNARQVGCVVLAGREAREQLVREICAVYRRFGRALENPLLRGVLTLWAGSGRVRELREALPGLRWAEEQFLVGRDPLFHHAPAVLVLHAPPAETAEADCALAAGQVSLLAPSLGLGTCHIGYASALLKRFPRLGRRHGVPSGHRGFAVLTLGYPAVTWQRLPPRPALPVRWR